MIYTGFENLSDLELVSASYGLARPTELEIELAKRLEASADNVASYRAAIEAAQGVAEVARDIVNAQQNEEPWEFLRDAEGRCMQLADAIDTFEEKDPGL